MELLPPVLRADGSMVAQGRIAVPGVYAYRNRDGSTRKELLLPEELHDPESLKTLARVPLTIGHPPGLKLTPELYSAHAVGDTGELVEVLEDGHVKIEMTIRARKALDAVDPEGQDPLRGLSAGYTLEALERTTPDLLAKWPPHEFVQRGRRYSHVCLCPLGRHGPSVHLRADSDDFEQFDGEHPSKPPAKPPSLLPRTDKSMTLLERLMALLDDDGAEVAAMRPLMREVASMLKELEEKLSASTEKADESDGKIAALEAESTKLKADAKEADDARGDEASILTANIKFADDRAELLELAGRHRCDSAEVEKLGLPGLRRAIVTASGAKIEDDASDAFVAGALSSMIQSAETTIVGDDRYADLHTARGDAAPKGSEVKPLPTWTETMDAAFEANRPKA